MSASKKSTGKKAAKKAPARKPAAKKVAAKKPAAKKPAAKKVAAKKPAAKKPAVKKQTTQRVPAKKTALGLPGAVVRSRAAANFADAPVLPNPTQPVRVSKPDALIRTIIMLSIEWHVDRNRISPNSRLTAPPLNGNANALGALESPIENRYFGDVNCRVTQTALRALATPTSTVANLRDVIWAGIPAANKRP